MIHPWVDMYIFSYLPLHFESDKPRPPDFAQNATKLHSFDKLVRLRLIRTQSTEEGQRSWKGSRKLKISKWKQRKENGEEYGEFELSDIWCPLEANDESDTAQVNNRPLSRDLPVRTQRRHRLADGFILTKR